MTPILPLRHETHTLILWYDFHEVILHRESREGTPNTSGDSPHEQERVCLYDLYN